MNEALLEPERVTLLELLDRLLETGVVVDGVIDLSVADIELIHLGLKLVLASSATLEQHSSGSVTHSGEPTDDLLHGLPGERSFDSTIYPRPPILTEAASQAGALAQPGCTAETVSWSRSTPAREQDSEGVCSRIDRCEGTQELPVGGQEKVLSRIDPERAPGVAGRVEQSDFESAKIEHGLAKLVLTLVELIRRLMEKQAIRKMEGGRLSAMQVERLGEAFRRLEIKMGELKRVFGLADEELNLDLGPLGAVM
jgi:hypothetical protein